MDHSYSNSSEEVTSTLEALCRQEETSYRITANYLTELPPRHSKVAKRRAKCRAAMVTWCITVVDYLEFDRDTVVTALSFLDRFLETTQGQACLTTPRQFKIAGMTCLYTAIKAHEPEAIEPELVVELSGNLCDIEDIEAMERTLLSALQWRVNPPTALAFCRILLDSVVPSCLVSREDCASLLDLAQVQTELAVSDPRLIGTPPSTLALASIFNALESKQSAMETLDDLSQLFFVALGSSNHLDMDAVFDVQDILDDIIRTHNSTAAEEEDEEEPVVEEEHDSPISVAKTSSNKKNDEEHKHTPINVSPSALRYKAAEAA